MLTLYVGRDVNSGRQSATSGRGRGCQMQALCVGGLPPWGEEWRAERNS